MPSTYSSNLKIELMSTGENSGTWGNITNTNLGTALEQAVVGYGAVSYSSDANLTISITNSNAAQAARALVINVTSAVSLTGTRELVVPTIEKQYIVQNNTTGSQSITVKTSAGTGITVPNGRKAHLYVDGTNVIQMFDFVDINGGTIDGATVGANSASSGAFTTLTASGATTLNGAVTLGDAAGDNITFNGTVTSHLLFTDNTYDIGANGATRPRNLFLAGAATIGGNLSVGGTLTLTGGVNLNGNVTVGDNSSDTLTINSTITSNLLFTDNTYDIGASGATRPRNLFLAGNATIGGNQTLTGSLTVDSTTDTSSATTGSIQTDGGVGIAKGLYVGGNTTLGDAAADNVTVNGTITSNLIFTDNTYDIGASGATRPRSLYLGTLANVTTAEGQILLTPTGYRVPSRATLLVKTLTNNPAEIDLLNTNGGVNYGWQISSRDGTTPSLDFYANSNNVFTNRLTLTSSSAVFNEDGNDYDFRVESDTNTHALFVDAGNSRVGVNTSNLYNSFTVGGAIEAGTASSVGGGVSMYMQYNGASGDYIGNIGSKNSSGGPAINYGGFWDNSSQFISTYDNFSGQHSSLYNGGYDIVFASDFSPSTVTTGSAVSGVLTRWQLGVSGFIFNEQGNDIDFRVESVNNTNMLFVDASTNRVGIAQSSPGYELHVGAQQASGGTAGTIDRFAIQPYSNTGGPYIFKARTVSGASDFLDLYYGSAQIASFGLNQRVGIRTTAPNATLHVDGEVNTIVAQVSAPLYENGGGSLSKYLDIKIGNSYISNYSIAQAKLRVYGNSWNNSASALEIYTMTNAGADVSNVLFGQSESVFNENSADIDFRVESNDTTHMLFVDGGTNRVNVGTSSAYASVFTTSATGGYSSGDVNAMFVNPSGRPTIRLRSEASDACEIFFDTGGGVAWDISCRSVGEGKPMLWFPAAATPSYASVGAQVMTLTQTGNLTITGALAKGSGSFLIEHPLPALAETHNLVHSFIEAPQADLYYRGKVALVNGKAVVNIDEAAGMTDGTFVLLNREVQCFTSNESDWDAVRGFVSGNILTIECQNPASTATVSWLVVGERQDKHMYDTDWTDENGKVIVEPIKPPPIEPPTFNR